MTAVILLVGVFSGVLAVDTPPGTTSAGATIAGTLPGVNFYPRVIELEDAGPDPGTVLATTNDGRVGRIWKSSDEGETFSLLTEIDPGPDAVGLCCIELFEFPADLGPFPAGTLLWSGSVTTDIGPPRQMELRVWRSDDQGVSWTPTAPCATSSAGGLWEPEFHVTNDGELACMFSDESDQPAHSQLLAQTFSTDGGQSWGARQNVVALDNPFNRPGMSTTAQLPDGSWVMTYEICTAFPNCGVWLRRSTDGRDWGPVTERGSRVTATDGSYLAHTPVITWTPAGGGTLILSGQQLFNADHSVAAGNGRTLFINQKGGAGPWTPVEAPVPVDDPVDNFCPNYSSPVIDLDGNGLLLEMASTWAGPVCVTQFGTERLNLTPPSSPTTTAPTSTTLGPADGSQPTTTSTTALAQPAPAATPVIGTPSFTG